MAGERDHRVSFDESLCSVDLPWGLQAQQHQTELRRHSSLPLPASQDVSLPSQCAYNYKSQALPSSSSSSSATSQVSVSYSILQQRTKSANFNSGSPPGSPRSMRGGSASFTQNRVYKLNVSPRDLPDTMASPRVSDVGGLSRFLPSNHEGDQDDLTAWEGALKSAELVSSTGTGLQISDVSVYSSDEFRMYEFKVRRCMRGRSHDWTDCPFAHPGEKARRRDPRKYHYSGTACPEFRKGACRRGDACEFAHGVFECWLHPARYRTQPCKDGRNCKRRVCFFAHTPEQLRLLPAAAVAASQSLPGDTFSTGVGAEAKPCGPGGPTRLSPTSTLAGPSSSPGVSPPLTPEVSPPTSPSHPEQFGPQRSPSWGPCGPAVGTQAMQGGQFTVQVSVSPRHFPGAPSPRAAPTWGSPLSPAGPQTGTGILPPAPTTRSMAGMTAAALASSGSMLLPNAQGALRQRQLERLHSLPTLSIPSGIDPGPLSVSSPYAASPSHHRLALMQAAAAAATASCTSPNSANSASTLSNRSSLPYSAGAEQQAMNNRAVLINELVASLQALEVQSHQAGWLQPQQEAQAMAQLQARVQAQAHVQAQWQAEAKAQGAANAIAEAQAQAHALVQERMRRAQQIAGSAAAPRLWTFEPGDDAGMARHMAGVRWDVAEREVDAREGGLEGARQGDGERRLGGQNGGRVGNGVQGASDSDGSDVAWVNNLVRDDGGAGVPPQDAASNSGSAAPATNPWANTGHWVSTAHA